MRQKGFTYIGILIAVAVMGVLLSQIAAFWQKTMQREREKELVAIGDEFRRAIGAYYENSPGVSSYPRSLDDLILDKRLPSIRRYLRKIYVDPMTGKPEWGLVKGSAEGITGVYSLSGAQPVKDANFSKEDASLSGKKHYSEWIFSYQAASAPVAVAATAAAPPPAAPPQVPPAYAPPVVAPPTSPKDRHKYLCDMNHATDITICGNILQKFGSEKGQYCLTSASARYSQCLAGTTMEPLGVFYQ
ncbi:MAG TPA: type II secretion system protein [Burkholderiales bacterium]|nr:type II secretion system protein [Burkholderiales bacterium]